MSSTGNKFFIVISFLSLGSCCFLSFWFFFVMTFVRNKDIKQYKIDNELIITNLYNATRVFLYDLVTNKTNISTSSKNIDLDDEPNLVFDVFGYADYLGKPVAIYPNDIYFYEGDFHKYGVITRITERAIYCLSSSNTITIVRQKAKEATPARKNLSDQGASPSRKDSPAGDLFSDFPI